MHLTHEPYELYERHLRGKEKLEIINEQTVSKQMVTKHETIVFEQPPWIAAGNSPETKQLSKILLRINK